MIELPGPWIAEVRSCDIESMKKAVLREFGPDVNLANIDVRTIIDTEAARVGLGTAGPLSA
jgi:phosphosulfolactate synthase